jgi:hypothetical protein
LSLKYYQAKGVFLIGVIDTEILEFLSNHRQLNRLDQECAKLLAECCFTNKPEDHLKFVAYLDKCDDYDTTYNVLVELQYFEAVRRSNQFSELCEKIEGLFIEQYRYVQTLVLCEAARREDAMRRGWRFGS